MSVDNVEQPCWDEKFDSVLRQILPELPAVTPEIWDRELRALGLNSVKMVELLLRLETAYGTTLFDDDLDHRHFSTPRTMWDFVARRVNLDAAK
ncbi:acyl carrier protein [Streptomyces cellostaticus]|uniref:acyl carrier protein n=1 Tax=Streptomyces cellostaticus TaxID=67285 RepID=UPI002026DB6A|nr:acyl carrier protein [Streptomyces cellostaticus]